MKNHFIITIFISILLLFLTSTSTFAALQSVPAKTPPQQQRDKFQTDLFTGGASYAYPIQVPPGTNGLAPEISLTYSSLGANDHSTRVGKGWQINHDYIERDTHFSPKETDTNDDTFKLFFQGTSYELVFVSSENRYHTKIESFLNIQKLTSGAQNSTGEYWQVITKDGTKYRFGNQQTSEQLCDGRNYVYRWNLDQIEDTHNNHIYYTFLEDNGNSYLTKIEYNNDKQRTVDFGYNTSPSQGTVYPQGCRVSENQRLANIQIKANNNLVHQYDLAYTPASNSQSLTTSITEKGNNGTALPATSFDYHPEIKSWHTQHENWINEAYIDVVMQSPEVKIIDVNGDGLPDIVKSIAWGGGKVTWRVWLNTGSGWNTQHQEGVGQKYIDVTLQSGEVVLADVNGDGLPDIVKSID